ncbi:hypothetical protein GALMADRAFT_160252 [Galerina marginata CBS 339.88]|uniref:Cytochrome P450 n=1 Tax=Galerina marginata (strain CBS 339.88) TaxID=685588 RepID=A0A067SFR6_GALM3|nr:hypothetical protein GALMADRAFT_160252 [Galerina marginata CBS 339.88]
MGILISIVYASLFVWLAWKLVSLISGKQQGPYPPGPKTLPLVGNMFDLPLSDSPKTYAEWGRKYNSNLLHASALGNHLLIINSCEDADELFERRSRKYSGRPALPVTKLMGWEFNVGLLPYGELWRFHRKICQQNFSRKVAPKYHAVELEKVHQMLRNLLNTPENFDDHNKMLSISIPMAAMYGYDVKSFDDPCIVAANQSFILGNYLLLPGSTYINILPALAYIPAWFPGASSRKVAAKVRHLTKEMKRIPMEFVKKGVEEGTVIPSLVGDFFEKKCNAGASIEEEEATENVANTVYGAASDTTISSTGTFFYLMALHPDIQMKAQAEIDSVIGQKRLPDFNDRDSLPYVEAIYRELMRIRPPVPLGVPHALTEDDYYKGYFIPKGTTVIGNIWAMTHNEKEYPESFKFKPERFLDENGNLNGDDKILAYGFGRRICAGQHIASSTMWIIITSVLACFNISKSKDKAGKEIEIKDDYDDFGLVTGNMPTLSHKAPFECSFVPRSSMAVQLIANTK